jgi:hypothetical protein
MNAAKNKGHLIRLLGQLNKAKQKENHLELILVGNILIREQTKFIYENIFRRSAAPQKKFNLILTEIINRPVVIGGSSAKITSKKNLKAVKLWKAKFDTFFKILKKEIPSGQKALAEETLKIAAMLQTMVTKC